MSSKGNPFWSCCEGRGCCSTTLPCLLVDEIWMFHCIFRRGSLIIYSMWILHLCILGCNWLCRTMFSIFSYQFIVDWSLSYAQISCNTSTQTLIYQSHGIPICNSWSHGIDLWDDSHNEHAAKFSHVFIGLPYILWYGSPRKTWENIVQSHISWTSYK